MDKETELGGVLDIGKLVDKLNELVDRFKMQGKVHVEVTITHDVLKTPIFISADIPLPPAPAKAEAAAFGTDYRTVITSVYSELKNEGQAHDAKFEAAVADHKHPLLWKMMEHATIRKYERQTGKHITEGFDWTSIKDWLKQNWPKIISTLVSIIMLFIAM